MKHTFSMPEPKTFYYHYSNKNSQGALMNETTSFPKSFDDKIHDCYDAYTDRLMEWDYNNYQKACKVLNSDNTSLQNASDEKLVEFAHIALKTPIKPEHVRVIHYFNVSTGFSCPLIVAVFKK